MQALHPILLRLADAAYRRGTPLISDAVFDRLARLCPRRPPPTKRFAQPRLPH